MLRGLSAVNYEKFPKVSTTTAAVWLLATTSGLAIGGLLSFPYSSGLATIPVFEEFVLLLPSLVVGGLVGSVSLLLGNCTGDVSRRVIPRPKTDQVVQREKKQSKYVELTDPRPPAEPSAEDTDPVTERRDNEEQEEEEEDLPSYLAFGEFEAIQEEFEAASSPTNEAPKRFFSPRAASSPSIEAARPNTARAAQGKSIKFNDIPSSRASPQGGDTKTTHISYMEDDFESDSPPQRGITLEDPFRRDLATNFSSSRPAVHALVMRSWSFLVSEASFYFCLINFKALLFSSQDDVKALTLFLIVAEIGGYGLALYIIPRAVKRHPLYRIWTVSALTQAAFLVLCIPAAEYGGVLAASALLPLLIASSLVCKSMSSLYLYDAVHPCEYEDLESYDEISSTFAKAFGCVLGCLAAVSASSYSAWPFIGMLSVLCCGVPLYLKQAQKYFTRYCTPIEA
jgi:hypothetical protein